MAAEGLPAGTPCGWELEGWYQDLQEVLAAEPGGPSLPWGAEQAEVAPLWGTEGSGGGPEGCELAAALAAELLGPESAAGTEPAGPRPPGSASSSSPPARAGAEEDEAAAGRGVKRKRCSGAGASRELAKHRERANEQRVLELTARNEQLREEIQRLSAEVERTRAALIDHIVNLRRN
ncbi:PREDICTED: DNA damage-inducible transcript 3 protein [Calidris pugnax]|uniref:DNA damage-inducible transcript 3 protein n=1 Tax=Calidris pugnax TaxID=198806 RepID=UPI00071C5F8D|nr:PREDICTED: DNA damage-inducible transcript 3 protein [Calidris pugnax]